MQEPSALDAKADLKGDEAPHHFAWLASALADPQNDFSFGAFGAFGQIPKGRRIQIDSSEEHIVVATESAKIVMTPHTGLRLVAFETLSSDSMSWNHAIALCLPKLAGRMTMRKRLTALGPDFAAIDAKERKALHFDIGLGYAYADVFVREREPDGKRISSTVDTRIAADEALNLFADETWIFQTGLGRLEVMDARRRYVIPSLLASGATHVADAPIPENLVPVGYVFPPNPAQIQDGVEAAMRHAQFQSLFSRFGDPSLVQFKHVVESALAKGLSPDSVLPLSSGTKGLDRLHTTCIRVALRQYRWRNQGKNGAIWEALFDKPLSRRCTD